MFGASRLFSSSIVRHVTSRQVPGCGMCTVAKPRHVPVDDEQVIPFRPSLKIEPKELKLYTRSHIPAVLNAYLDDKKVDPLPFMAAACVLPMRANNYVIDELIDWSDIPNDPIFQLVFPQPEMLNSEDLDGIKKLLQDGADRIAIRDAAEKIREKMNPHPANQKTLNVPKQESGEELPGMQHKYRETVLFFPSEGQYCQSFCTYCFRWAQFTAVGSDQAFQCSEADLLRRYLSTTKCISDVLFTGGDPMVLTAKQWHKYLDPLTQETPDLDHIATVRIGTKSLGYWPYRFLTDPDADDLLRLLETVVKAGRHVAIMAHFTHPRELSTPAVQEAIRRLQMTGAVIRSQAPLVNHVNADPVVWAMMWRAQVRLGIVPYYMFVERDTGAKHYFEVPLEKAVNIYNTAVSSVSGIARTVRGPSMSATPGKVHVVGLAEVNGEKVFALRFLQARNPQWMDRIFFAQYDPKASWLNDLKPAFGEKEFFFERELDEISSASTSSGTLFPYDQQMAYHNMVI